MSYIEVKNVKKEYKTGEIKVEALQDVSFSVEKGELIVILGPSGTGKTTLLNVIGGIDKVDSGEIIIDGNDIAKYSDKQLVEYRKNEIGFVFQDYNLLQNLTAYENVEFAIKLTKENKEPKEFLDKVGLENRANHFPAQLSGGEQQRVSIARALIKNPKVLLCDEPTGALDYKTSKQILKLLEDTSRKDNNTVIIITHNNAVSQMADKVIKFNNGSVEEIIVNNNPVSIDEISW